VRHYVFEVDTKYLQQEITRLEQENRQLAEQSRALQLQ
jgi:predicted ATP-grasp superfamily ATP-dependent carboligase